MSGMRARGAVAVVLGVLVTVSQGAHGASRLDIPTVHTHARFAAGRALVRFEPGAPEAVRRAALDATGARVISRIPRIGWNVVALPASADVRGAVASLKRAPGVASAEPDFIGEAAITPNDQCVSGCSAGNLLAKQWSLTAINALQGWSVSPGQFYTSAQKAALTPIKVAVLDTKIATGLSDWANVAPAATGPNDARNGGQLDLTEAKDFVALGGQQGSDEYHGTFVAGILGAASNNGGGIAGVGYRAEVVPVTVVHGDGAVLASELAAGLVYAGGVARVINTSLAFEDDSDAVHDAVLDAQSNGALIVSAAGNKPEGDVPTYPAWYDHVMAVGATDEAGRPGSCTNHSPHTSIAAPGEAIVSLDIRSSTGIGVTPCGTSTATPQVSGLAALLFGQDPTRTAAQVKSIIESSAEDDAFFPGVDDYYGHGRINVERALRLGDGAPTISRLRAGVPSAFGDKGSNVTALGTAVDASGVRDAEYFLDVTGAPGTGGSIAAADGAFNEREESLVAEVPIPLSVPTGVHHLFVRAYDGTRWGPFSVTELIVDRTPPTISHFSVSPFGTPVSPATITFKMDDDRSYALTYVVRVTRQGVGDIVYTSPADSAPHASTVTTKWTPGPLDAGPATIQVIVTDESGNRTTASSTMTAL